MPLIRRIFPYFRPYWGYILLSMACMGVVGGTSGVSAWLVKPVLDGIFIEKDVRKLQLLPLAILGLYVVKGICRYVQSYVMRWIGETVILRMREDLLSNIAYRDMAFFDRNTTGHLMARVTNDVGAMQNAIPDLVQLLRQSFTVLGLVFVLFKRDWQLACLALVIFPVAAYPLRRISVLMRRYARKGQQRVGDMANILQESFSGIEVVKLFGCERREIDRFRTEGERLRHVRLKSARLNELTSPFMEFLGAIGISLIIWYGGRQVISGATTTGSFFSFLTALFMLYDPLKRAGMLSNNFQQALAAAERVFGLMDQPTAPSESEGTLVLRGPVERVEFRDVRFTYDPAKGEVLRGVSFSTERGRTVALVGMSGAGKSTLLKLLPRFYNPDSGAILFDGRDLREFTVGSVRSAVAVVTQDTFLFNDTVRSNLLVARPGAKDEEMVEAAKAARAHDFILELPLGYETVLGERGDFLSGGQKQRIAIARALLKNAPVLVLDEATSALDSASEREVQAAFEVLMRGRTTFVIAHRLSTIRHADCILVMSGGQVVETGTHEELEAHGGEYARLCRLQFQGSPAGG